MRPEVSGVDYDETRKGSTLSLNEQVIVSVHKRRQSYTRTDRVCVVDGRARGGGVHGGGHSRGPQKNCIEN